MKLSAIRSSALFTSLLSALLAAICMASCGYAGTPSPVSSSENRSSAPTPSVTNPPSPTAVSDTAVSPAASPSPTAIPRERIDLSVLPVDSAGNVFQVLSSQYEYSVDLNSDGVKEIVSIDYEDDPDCYCDKYNLVINGKSVSLILDCDDWTSSWLVLTDLDKQDGYIDILHEGGSFDWLCSYFFYYTGKDIIYRGSIWDSFVACDPDSGTDIHKPISLLPEKISGNGAIVMYAEGTVVYNYWYFPLIIRIGANGFFTFDPCDPIIEMKDASLTEHPQLTLKMDLPLYADLSSPSASITARKGEKITLIKTDDRQWIQVRRVNGEYGWFRTVIGSYFSIVIGTETFYSPLVFKELEGME